MGSWFQYKCNPNIASFKTSIFFLIHKSKYAQENSHVFKHDWWSRVGGVDCTDGWCGRALRAGGVGGRYARCERTGNVQDQILRATQIYI